ncbi:MAG: FKBP-type peptidyl-prolyl cis-trans isomerase [Euryarchaeota archaeon]|nr:FKBP-type peptidyl-prolyl cis-trans isomerase [Euryarchaeota archaeon]
MAKKSKKLERKLKRKKQQKSFYHQNKKIIYSAVIICIVVFSSFLFYTYMGARKEQRNTVGVGDTIEINFIGGYKGHDPSLSTIVDENTTWESTFDDSHEYNPKKYGVGYVYDAGFWRALANEDTNLVGKKTGDVVELSLRTEDVFIQGDPTFYYELPDTKEVERVQNTSLNSTIPTSYFTQQFGAAKEGDMIDTVYGKAVVAAANNATTTIEFVSKKGDEFNSLYGKAVVKEINKEENKIYIQHDPKIGDIVYETITGVMGQPQVFPMEITEVTEEKIKLKRLKYIKLKVKIEEITEKYEGKWKIEKGDQVSIDYTGKLENGTVFDTTYKEIADDNSTKKAETFREKGVYKPLTIGSVNYEGVDTFMALEEQLLGMKEGDEKTITLTPEEAYGEYKEEDIYHIPLVEEVPIEKTVKKERVISQKEFIEEYGQPLEGKEIYTKFGKAKILEITSEGNVRINQTGISNEIFLEYFNAELVGETEETLTYKRVFKEKITTKNGSATVEEKNGKFVVALDIEGYSVGDEVRTEYGDGEVIEVNDEEFVVDTNHPLAGKTLTYTVKIVEIRKPMGQ